MKVLEAFEGEICTSTNIPNPIFVTLLFECDVISNIEILKHAVIRCQF